MTAQHTSTLHILESQWKRPLVDFIDSTIQPLPDHKKYGTEDIADAILEQAALLLIRSAYSPQDMQQVPWLPDFLLGAARLVLLPEFSVLLTPMAESEPLNLDHRDYFALYSSPVQKRMKEIIDPCPDNPLYLILAYLTQQALDPRLRISRPNTGRKTGVTDRQSQVLVAQTRLKSWEKATDYVIDALRAQGREFGYDYIQRQRHIGQKRLSQNMYHAVFPAAEEAFHLWQSPIRQLRQALLVMFYLEKIKTIAVLRQSNPNLWRDVTIHSFPRLHQYFCQLVERAIAGITDPFQRIIVERHSLSLAGTDKPSLRQLAEEFNAHNGRPLPDQQYLAELSFLDGLYHLIDTSYTNDPERSQLLHIIEAHVR